MTTPAVDPDRKPVVRIGTQKGGTGRSTTVANSAHELARLGATVLLIDADSNAHLTESNIGYDAGEGGDATIKDLIESTDTGAAADMILEAPSAWQPRADLPYEAGGAVPGTNGRVAFIPGSNAIDSAVEGISGAPGSERRLAKGLSGVARHFDLVLIDTGSSPSRLAWIILHAAYSTLGIANPEDAAAKGIANEIDLNEAIAEAYDLDLRFVGAVCTKFSTQSKATHGEGVDHIKAVLAGVDQTPLTTPLAMPGPVPGAPNWTSGAALWPEILPDRKIVPKLAKDRLPLAASQHALADPTSAFFLRKDAVGAQPLVRGIAQLGVRLLQATESKAFADVAKVIADHPEYGLFPPAEFAQVAASGGA